MKDLEDFDAILDFLKWQEELKAKRQKNLMTENPLSSVPGLQVMQEKSAAHNRMRVLNSLTVHSEEQFRYSYETNFIGIFFLFFLGGTLLSVLLVKLCLRFMNKKFITESEVIDAEFTDSQQDDYEYPYEDIDEVLRRSK